MKKIFWTSMVWLFLFGSFLLYMKWFNQPLAIVMTDFLVKGHNAVINEIVNEVVELEEPLVNDVATEVVPVEVPESLLNMDKEPEITSSQYLVDRNWMKLFDQLDKIEVLIGNKTAVVEVVSADAKPSEEEMFDEFKIWYEKNKK